jgi:hypothetical protein
VVALWASKAFKIVSTPDVCTIKYRYLICTFCFRSSAASKTTAPSGIRGNDVSELSIPGVGLVKVDNTPVERSLKGKKVAQQGRLQGRATEEPSVDILRASFTLNGMSVGANG